MVDTLVAAWKEEYSRRDVQPVLLFDFELRSYATDALETFKWCTGPIGVLGYDPIFDLPESIGVEMDPITREISIQDIRLAALNKTGVGGLRDALDTHFVKGKKVTVWLGTPNLTKSEYLQLGLFVVSRLNPSPAALDLVLEDAWSIIRDVKLPRMTWVNRQPLKALRMILEAIDLSTDLWDNAAAADGGSLDPALGANVAVGHHVITRTIGMQSSAGSVLPSDDDTVGTLISELVQLEYGSLFMRASTGKLIFKLYDDAKAVDRVWTVDDRDIVLPEDIWDGGINTASLRLATHVDNDFFRFEQEYETAQDKSGFSAKDGELRYDQETKWLNAASFLTSNIQASDGAGVTFRVRNAQGVGFSGTGTLDDGQDPVRNTVPSWAQASATNLVYVLLTSGSSQTQNGRVEVIACDSVVKRSTNGDPFITEVRSNGYLLRRLCAYEHTFTIKTRNALTVSGSAGAQTWIGPSSNSAVYALDVTVAVRYLLAILRRALWGLPRLSVRTWFDQFDMEIGDFVSVDNVSMVPHRPLGSVPDQVWEIVGKRLVLKGDDAGLHFMLALVRDPGAPVGQIPTLATVVHRLAEPSGTEARVRNVLSAAGAGVISADKNRIVAGGF